MCNMITILLLVSFRNPFGILSGSFWDPPGRGALAQAAPRRAPAVLPGRPGCLLVIRLYYNLILLYYIEIMILIMIILIKDHFLSINLEI